MASAIISGEIRISNQGNVFAKSLTALTTVSQWFINQVVLANGASDFVVSLPNVSNPTFMALTATSVCRANIGGTSAISAGSAGLLFRDLYAIVGCGVSVSGPFSLHLSNSSGDSAVVTMALAQ